MENIQQRTPRLILEEQNPAWLKQEGIVRTYIADRLPAPELCSSAYAFVFKDGAILQTEQREGERSVRQFDIPGGHVDPGETLEQAVVRETFEETGVRVKVVRLIGYKEAHLSGEKPDGFKYPFPVSVLPYYLCEVIEETIFAGDHETHGRKWIPLSDTNESKWCVENKLFLDEVVHESFKQ